VGTVVIGISLMFTTIPVIHLGLSCLVFLLTAILFALAGFINAVFADSFDDISIIPNFILTPLTYLGGVFYSVDMLPELWQKISLANPILYIVNSFRYGLIGVTDIDITVALTMIISFIIALIIFSLYLLKKGVGIKQ